MSFHRTLLTGIYIITATTAWADIDLSLYQNFWPYNYFKTYEYGIGSTYDKGDKIREECHRNSGAFTEDTELKLIDYDNDDGDDYSERWLLLGSEYSKYQPKPKILCGEDDEDAGQYLYDKQQNLYDYFVKSVKYTEGGTLYGANPTFCRMNKIVNDETPQEHITVKKKPWQNWVCSCEGDTCRWKPIDPQYGCDGADGMIKEGETRKNLLQFREKIYLCGFSTNDTVPVGMSNYSPTETYEHPVSITRNSGACPNGVQFAAMEPQKHLGDTTGGKIWQCQKVGGQWQWTLRQQVPPCAADTIPETGLSNQSASDMFARGPSGNNTRRLFVRKGGAYDDIEFGLTGYTGLTDLIDDNTRLTDIDGLCTTSICVGKDIFPNHNNSACVKRNYCRRGVKDDYAIGSLTELLCEDANVPRASIYQDLYSYEAIRDPNETKCTFLCTEKGWVIRFRDGYGNPCKDGYAPSTDMRDCISLDGFSEYLCTQSGGKFNPDRKKCSGCWLGGTLKFTPYDSGAAYEYCNKNADFNPENALDNFIKEAESASESAAGATSTMAATDTISDLAGRLALVEDQFGLSKWRTAEGKFNTARLASDLTAGVVLGTTGALVTSSVVKKKQVKDGFESLECTVGGQHVGDWGDVFRIDGK